MFVASIWNGFIIKIKHPFGCDSSPKKYLSFSANALKIMMNRHLHFPKISNIMLVKLMKKLSK